MRESFSAGLGSPALRQAGMPAATVTEQKTNASLLRKKIHESEKRISGLIVLRRHPNRRDALSDAYFASAMQ